VQDGWNQEPVSDGGPADDDALVTESCIEVGAVAGVGMHAQFARRQIIRAMKSWSINAAGDDPSLVKVLAVNRQSSQ
jgi:hypothetical protein